MPDDSTTGIPPAGTSPHLSPAEGRPPEVGDPATTAVPPAADPSEGAGAPDAGASGDDAGASGDEEEARRAAAALRDVAATGTAIHQGERDSALDLGDTPGTAGTGAGG